MAQLETWFRQDLKQPLKVQYLGGNLFSQDNQANLIGAEVFDEGVAATLGGSVSASVIRADGGTVTVPSGTVSGNKASVVLPQAAYAVPGQVSIVLKLTQSGVVTTLAALVAIVYKSSTDTVIDPGTILPSVETLIAQINTAVASIPADYSSLWTSLAPAFSDSTAYAAGQYFTYNGHVYRFTANHAAGSFVSTDCTQVDIGGELSALKSAITSMKSATEIVQSESGSVVSFENCAGDALNSLIVEIRGTQSGSGDPSISNVRTLNGYTGANIYVGAVAGSADETYPVDWETEAGTVYHGSLNVTTGVLTVDWVIRDMSLFSDIRKDSGTNEPYVHWFNIKHWNTTYDRAPGNINLVCDCLKTVSRATSDNEMSGSISNSDLYIYDSTISTVEEFKTKYAGHYIAYEVKDQLKATYQLSAQEVLTLVGNTSIWANTGDVEASFVEKTQLYIDNGLSGKQDTLTFDEEPTEESSNPVTSSGIKNAIDDAIGNVASDVSEINSTLLNEKKLNKNNLSIFNGGTNKIPFEVGGVSISGGIATTTTNDRYARTNFDRLPLLSKGDTISVSSGYIFVAYVAKYVSSTLTVENGSGAKSSDYVIPESGLYLITVEKSPQSVITGNEAESAITITHKATALTKSDIAPTYPYVTNPVNAGKIVWKNSKLLRRYSQAVSSIEPYVENAWEETSISKELDAKTYCIRNLHAALKGGTFKPLFEQGTTTATSGYLVNSTSSQRVRTRFDCLPYMFKGDYISVSDGYAVTINPVTVDVGGIVSANPITGTTVQDDGLYFIQVYKTNSNDITPDEGYEAVTIHHNGVKHLSYIDDRWEKDVKSILPKNPYYGVPFRSRRSSSVPWVYGIHEVVSCSHAHCETQEEFDELKQHYDHMAISNYYPSVPYYPLEGRFNNVGNKLGSPNAEIGVEGRYNGPHVNAIGSFISSPIGWDNIDDYIRDAMRFMKTPNGGGITINHPKWTGSHSSASDILAIMGMASGIIGLEVWNASCERLNGKGDSSEIWDAILSTGTQLFAMAVPDHEWQRSSEDIYGNGYNHMLVTNFCEDEVLVAYRTGRFYCTKFNDGLKMTYIDFSNEGLLSIEVNDASTYKFITATRNVEVTTAATSATFQTQDGDVYVRVEVYHGDNILWTNAIML